MDDPDSRVRLLSRPRILQRRASHLRQTTEGWAKDREQIRKDSLTDEEGFECGTCGRTDSRLSSVSHLLLLI